MTDLPAALRGARHPAPGAPLPSRRILMAGAGGALGAAVLERMLGGGGFDDVVALVERPLRAAPRRLQGWSFEQLAAAAGRTVVDSGVVVFDRGRGRHGREDVFVQPRAEALPALAGALVAAGVRRLLVVLPHAPATLPQAMKAGLASLDEQAVAAMGFEHLVFVRPVQAPRLGNAEAWPQRLADALLRQLHWAVPLREQPVRADRVAAFVVAMLHALPHASPGTRVAPPELVWRAAQPADLDALVRRWLADGELPAVAQPRQRW